MKKRRDGTPIWVNQGVSRPLARLEMTTIPGQGYDEAWIQQLIHAHPEAIPLSQIDPSFGRAVSVCRELPLAFGAGRTGALDNFLITPEGGLILVETKLWRNPEARRTVVAQAMEYAASVFQMRFEALEAAVAGARKAAGEVAASIYELAGSGGELDEKGFVDAVTHNLQLGRAIIAVVGDGIREDILPLAGLLQSHAGLRFTFALVELAVYATLDGANILMPSVLAQTVLIERGVVSIREGDPGGQRIVVDLPNLDATGIRTPRAMSIGEDEFFENIDIREPGSASILKCFLSRAEELGIYIDLQSGLNIKHASREGKPLNLATIRKDGFVDTSPATWWERAEIGRRYNETLASATGGTVSYAARDGSSALRTAIGKTPRLSMLLPDHAEAWLRAMSDYILALTEES